eukprot:2423025-Prymnesium_polylepis.1
MGSVNSRWGVPFHRDGDRGSRIASFTPPWSTKYAKESGPQRNLGKETADCKNFPLRAMLCAFRASPH